MSSDDKDKKLLQLEREFRETVVSELRDIRRSQDSLQDTCDGLEKKVDLHIQKTEFELEAISQLDQHQNMLIDEHIRGVQNLDKIVDDQKEHFDKRLRKLESSSIFFKQLETYILRLGALAGAFYGIGKFLAWWK